MKESTPGESRTFFILLYVILSAQRREQNFKKVVIILGEKEDGAIELNLSFTLLQGLLYIKQISVHLKERG